MWKVIITIILTTIIVSMAWLGLTYEKIFKPPLIKWTGNYDWDNLKTCLSYRSKFERDETKGSSASYHYIFCLKDDKSTR